VAPAPLGLALNLNSFTASTPAARCATELDEDDDRGQE